MISIQADKVPKHLLEFFEEDKENSPCGVCYLCHLMLVMQELNRVLRDDGCLFINLSDTNATHTSKRSGQFGQGIKLGSDDVFTGKRVKASSYGLQEKSLIGIPWRFALAMIDAGWVLRNDLIWHKPSVFPEPVTDRFAKSHEYFFFFTKSPKTRFWTHNFLPGTRKKPPQETLFLHRETNEEWDGEGELNKEEYKRKSAWRGWDYYFDIPSIMEPVSKFNPDKPEYRNPRDVLSTSNGGYEGHHATFPLDLIRPLLLASTSVVGACYTCGSQWARTLQSETFAPTCECPRNLETVPSVALDPFGGSGTVSALAEYLSRASVYIDVSEEFREVAIHRVKRIIETGILK